MDNTNDFNTLEAGATYQSDRWHKFWDGVEADTFVYLGHSVTRMWEAGTRGANVRTDRLFTRKCDGKIVELIPGHCKLSKIRT